MPGEENVAVDGRRLALCAVVALAFAALICWIVEIRSAPPPASGAAAFSHEAPV